MTSNEARATTLVRALHAGIERDRLALEEVYTDDVRAWTPALSTGSLAELIDELDHRDDAFSDIALEVTPLDVGGDYACVEWSVAMTTRSWARRISSVSGMPFRSRPCSCTSGT